MATATKEQKGNVTVAQLSGSIDENDDFTKLIGTPQGGLTVFCKGVTRINSLGVKNWIKYFTSVSATKIPLAFEEFPPPLIENLNMVQNFIGDGKVNSVIAPYKCAGCSTSLNATMKSSDIVKANFQMPPVKCPKCGQQATFDDLAEEYFAFLKKA